MVKVICDKCGIERTDAEGASWATIAIRNKHAADLCPGCTAKLEVFLKPDPKGVPQ